MFAEVIVERKQLWISKDLKATGSYANKQNFQFHLPSKDNLKNRYRNKV